MKYLKIIYGISLLSLFPALSFAQPATRYYGKPLTSQTQRFPTYAGPYQGAMPRPTSRLKLPPLITDHLRTIHHMADIRCDPV